MLENKKIHNLHELTHNGLHVFVWLIQLAQVQRRHPVEEKQERERSSHLAADVPHLHSQPCSQARPSQPPYSAFPLHVCTQQRMKVAKACEHGYSIHNEVHGTNPSGALWRLHILRNGCMILGCVWSKCSACVKSHNSHQIAFTYLTWGLNSLLPPRLLPLTPSHLSTLHFSSLFLLVTRRGQTSDQTCSAQQVTVHCITVHCITVHCITVHCITVHCITVHCITVRPPILQPRFSN